MNKKVNTILICFSLLSPFIGLMLVNVVGEMDVFGTAGMSRYIWIMWLFIPVCILLFISGIKLKNQGLEYMHSLVISIVCSALLIIFGMFGIIFDNFSFEISYIDKIEDIIGIELPTPIGVATEEYYKYNLTYAKVLDEERKHFEEELESSLYWKSSLGSKIKSLLPIEQQSELVLFEYFLLYNETTKEFNQFPPDGSYKIVFMAYDIDLQRLMIIDEYEICVD